MPEEGANRQQKLSRIDWHPFRPILENNLVNRGYKYHLNDKIYISGLLTPRATQNAVAGYTDAQEV